MSITRRVRRTIWTDRTATRMYEGAGLPPKDVDIFNPYDGYVPMAQFFLEAFQWHGVKRGNAFALYASDIRVEGPHPCCPSGGNLGNGRPGTAMYTDSIEELRGKAGARQVRVRAETAVAASPRQAAAARSCSENPRADDL
jgi:hypothetical protein